ncbi:MAG: DsrE family protein [Candidatus Eisenbacteria bacterium]|nr:DsrE family protein [Candidatus Eisenbacteria bacterium]
MKTLIVLNDAPYGSERAYNGIRLGGSLARREGVELRVFLMGDAAACARRGQKVPTGFYNIQTMLGAVARHGGVIGVCGSCMEARGIGEADLVEGAHRGSMDQLTEWTLEADKVIVF